MVTKPVQLFAVNKNYITILEIMELIKGEESLFYIKVGADYAPVACLTSNNFSEQSETIPTTTRENIGWATSLPTNQSYSIDLSGYMTKDGGGRPISYRELRRLKRYRVLIEWKITTLGGYYTDLGKGYITSISQDNEVDNMIGFSATLQGFGKPLEDDGVVYVLGTNDKQKVFVYDTDNKTIKV